MERAQPASPEKEVWDVLFGKRNSSSAELICCPLSRSDPQGETLNYFDAYFYRYDRQRLALRWWRGAR
jgi:hypothetical protein